jgi:hypothetical protein
MNYKRRSLRRKLVLFVTSVLPLLDKGENEDIPMTQHRRNLPQHEINNENEQQIHIKYRQFHNGNRIWTEAVLLPSLTTHSNGTTIIPFYPFDSAESINPIKNMTIHQQQQQQHQQIMSGNHMNATASLDDNNSYDRYNNSDIHQESKDINSDFPNDGSNSTQVEGTSNASVSNNNSSIPPTTKHVEVDYASKSAGAIILDSSPNFNGVSNLLQQDRDRYAIVPCMEPIKYIVIGLSEDILVKQIAIANYERYSSHMKEIRIYGSTSTYAIRNAESWKHLGNFIANNNTNIYSIQNFDIIEPSWVRYIKVEFISYHGNEYYCTVSQILVHGSTVLQGFHEQWNDNNVDDDNSNHGNVENLEEPSLEGGDTPEVISSNIAVHENTNVASDGIALSGQDKTDVINYESDGVNNDSVPVVGERYNLSGSNCRTSISFEEHLLRFSSSNNSEIDNTVSTTSNLISTRHHTFSKCCTSRTIIIPKKKAIRTLKIRHISTPQKSTSMSSVVPKENNGSHNRRLPNISSGIERVTDFVKSALGIFNVTGNDTTPHISTNIPIENDPRSEINQDIGTIVDTFDTKSRTKKSDNIDSNKKNIESIDETENMITTLLKRLPSAKCLKDLNGFNLKTAASTKSRHGVPGSNGDGSGSSNTYSATASMEPIFIKLSDEIKSLQSNLALHDQFAKESALCYQRIIFEILIEMESDRSSYSQRLSNLENEIKFGSFIVSLQRLSSQLLNLLLHNLHGMHFGDYSNLVVAFILLGGAITIAIFKYKRWFVTKNKVNSTKKITENGTISFQYRNDDNDDDDSSADITPVSPIVQLIAESQSNKLTSSEEK